MHPLHQIDYITHSYIRAGHHSYQNDFSSFNHQFHLIDFRKWTAEDFLIPASINHCANPNTDISIAHS